MSFFNVLHDFIHILLVVKKCKILCEKGRHINCLTPKLLERLDGNKKTGPMLHL